MIASDLSARCCSSCKPGAVHIWVQVYLPGPGWVDFDPSSGMVGNQNLVRVAVAHEPREAIPLQGTWIGTASDHLAMKVADQGHGGECPRRTGLRRHGTMTQPATIAAGRPCRHLTEEWNFFAVMFLAGIQRSSACAART